MTSAYIIKSLFTLIAICLVLYALLFSIKKIKKFPDSSFIKIKGIKPLQHATLYIVEIDSNEYTLGVNQHHIKLINKRAL